MISDCSINLVFVAGGPQLGQVESGVVVALANALVPQVAQYRADIEPAKIAAT